MEYRFLEGGELFPGGGGAEFASGAPAVGAADLSEPLGGWDARAARTPRRPRTQILELFRAPQNVAYLAQLFRARVPPGPLRDFALETLDESVQRFGQAEGLASSDPVAQRGDRQTSVGLWDEVRRLNRAFYEYRMQFLRDKAGAFAGGGGGGGGGDDDDDEPYHYRMFVADSLRPPGLEHLNGPGPLHKIHEDQVVRPGERPAPGARYPRREGFSASGVPTAGAPTAGAPYTPGVADDDMAWEGGNPLRTPEQALAEYWGEGATATGAAGPTNAELYAEGPRWPANGGTRFMRYPAIPIWQNLSRSRAYDRDIGETLAAGGREHGSHVRGWDLSRLRDPHGEEYRRRGGRYPAV
jgi:hypothetical protein